MAILEFPPVDFADADGLLAVGGDLDVESLLLAYRSGIFPWPVDDEHLTWFAPSRRAVIFVKDFSISKSLRRELRRNEYRFAFNENFEQVIRECAEIKNRGRQTGTWITEDIVTAYSEMQSAGFAHSIECYYEDELVGGLYGVAIGGMFAGESMFYRRSNASKLALWHAIEHLENKGVKWMDCQVINPFLKSLGAVTIDRVEYMTLLEEALAKQIKLFD